MKQLKKIIAWIGISLLLQFTVLAYINYFYLPQRSHLKASFYKLNPLEFKNKDIRLPNNATDVTVSFDGTYAAYKIRGNIVIINIDDGKKVKVITPGGNSPAYMKWLPDREMLIYSSELKDEDGGRIRISTYDVINGLERSYPDIEGLPKGSKAIDIILSPVTNIVYPIIRTAVNEVKVFKYDIMDNLEFVMDADTTMRIEGAMLNDVLIFQQGYGDIFFRDGKTGNIEILLPGRGNILLHDDDSDYIYIGELDSNGLVSGVSFGKTEQAAEEWGNLALEYPIAAGELYITAKGCICAVEKKERSIRFLGGTGYITYMGELITVTDKYAVSLKGNKLFLKMTE